MQFNTLAKPWRSIAVLMMLTGVLAGCGGGSIDQGPGTTVPSEQLNALPPHPLPDTNVLVGMTSNKVLATLGQPGLKRQDPPAELWQYRDGRCALNMFLYPKSGASGSLSVDHFHISSFGEAPMSATDCVYSLMTGHDPSER